MDHQTMRIRNEILDYLDYCGETTHTPVDDETLQLAQQVVDKINTSESRSGNDVLTPGQRQALEVSGDVVREVQLDQEEEEASPGQRAAESVQ